MGVEWEHYEDCHRAAVLIANLKSCFLAAIVMAALPSLLLHTVWVGQYSLHRGVCSANTHAVHRAASLSRGSAGQKPHGMCSVF
eukprot:148124-Pelagomonas_calceolata.AAC.14